MDLRGQDTADRVCKGVVLFFAVLGFLLGWALQDISLTLLVYVFGVLVAAVLTVPNWPAYSHQEVAYQRARTKPRSISLADRLARVFT